jgi:hypothetical protein
MAIDRIFVEIRSRGIPNSLAFGDTFSYCEVEDWLLGVHHEGWMIRSSTRNAEDLSKTTLSRPFVLGAAAANRTIAGAGCDHHHA